MRKTKFKGKDAVDCQKNFYDELIKTSEALKKTFFELAIAGVAIAWVFHTNPNYANLQSLVGLSMVIFVFVIMVDFVWSLLQLLFYYHYSNPHRLKRDDKSTSKTSPTIEVPLSGWSCLSKVATVLRILLLFIAYSMLLFCFIKMWNN